LSLKFAEIISGCNCVLFVRPVIPSFTKRPAPKKPEEISGGDGDLAVGRGGGRGRGGGTGRGGGRGGGPGRPRGRGRGRGSVVPLPAKVLTPGSYFSQVCKYRILQVSVKGNLSCPPTPLVLLSPYLVFLLHRGPVDFFRL
jgi:hypothetical protein